MKDLIGEIVAAKWNLPAGSREHTTIEILLRLDDPETKRYNLLRKRVVMSDEPEPEWGKPYSKHEQAVVSSRIVGTTPFTRAGEILDEMVARGWAPPPKQEKYRVTLDGQVNELGDDGVYRRLTLNEVVRMLNDHDAG